MILKILPKPPKCQEVKIQTGTVLTSPKNGKKKVALLSQNHCARAQLHKGNNEMRVMPAAGTEIWCRTF